MPAPPLGLAAPPASPSPSLICLDLPKAQTQTPALKSKAGAAPSWSISNTRSTENYCWLFFYEKADRERRFERLVQEDKSLWFGALVPQASI